MSDFSRWFKDNRIYELGLYDGCKEAWDHKEKEIQELKERLDKAIEVIKDVCFFLEYPSYDEDGNPNDGYRQEELIEGAKEFLRELGDE